jgi:peptidoglycan hydrolase-like protein with peptidoglycan-binding domain
MTTRTFLAAGAAILTAGSLAGTAWILAAKPRAAEPSDPVPVTSAAVTRGTVTQRLRIGGIYGYDGSYSVVHQGPPGIITAMAEPGSKVERGGVLYSVSDRAVRLLYGSVPAFRDFAPGMTDGPDVLQLEQNLGALGMDPLGQIKVDNHFTTATALAIRRWQGSWGLSAAQRTGALALGQVVFLSGALRVGQISAATGTAAMPNEPVLAATSTERVVTAEITADRQASVKVGDDVVVTLPGNAPLNGKVLRTGRVATVAEDNGTGRSGPATITVVIGVTVPAGSPDLDRAPVQISIAAAAHQNVLLVPVAALLARPGGGYRVRLSGAGYVDVEPGLFDEATGKVEVKGNLNVGDLVEVPVP